MSQFKRDFFIDITDVICPMTFVKAKVAIEELKDTEILEVLINEGEPLINVPKSFKEEGHKILDVINNGNGTFTLIVKKGGL